MEAIVYHGSSRKIQRFHGFTASKKKDRMLHGTGLYTCTSYRWATLYGRVINTMKVELDPAKSSRNVIVSRDDCSRFITDNITHKLNKHFLEYYPDKAEFSVYEFQHYLLVFYPGIHNKAQALNDWIVSNGVQYTTEFELKGDLLLIHDFRIIREMVDAKDYGYEEQPRFDKKVY